MTRKMVVWQPLYFPRLHYLARLETAEVFVIFDIAEFSRQSRQHRTEIDYGGQSWLTIPVSHQNDSDPIKDVSVDMSERWWKTHRKTITAKYGNEAPEPFVSEFDLELNQDISLGEFTVPLLRKIINIFDINIQIRLASEVEIEYIKGNASRYLARVTDYFNCDTYYCGRNAYDSYLDKEEFKSRGIEISIQRWESSWSSGNVNCLDVIYQSDMPQRHIK